MLHFKKLLLSCSVVGVIIASGSSVPAAPVTKTYVGTWSGRPGGVNPGGLAQGGKFVIKAAYDTTKIAEIPLAERNARGFQNPVFRVPLTDNPATGGTNTYELFIPMQGFGTIETQTGQDHFVIGSGFAPFAEIQFFDSSGTRFRGFEFESQFLTGNLVFEQFTADVNFSGTNVTNSSAQILDGNAVFESNITSTTVDVLSNSSAAAGGRQNPGVFLSEAVDVTAKAAGSALAYNASSLSVTTEAGTAQITDTVDPIISGQVRTPPSSLDEMPRQADNDLGAGRTDGEDFLTFNWTVDGTVVGEGTETGTRLDRVVTSDTSTALHYDNQGARSVDNVNINVAIQNSGLTNTTDSATWEVQVTEAFTGLTDTDSITVSYDNALPTILNATATAQGLGLQFDLLVADPDLAVNSLIVGFEDIMFAIFVDSIDQTGFFSDLTANDTGGTQLVSHADLISQFGVGVHAFRADVADFAGASDFQEFKFTVAPVPIPGTMVLLASGLACLGMGKLSRRRRKRDSIHSHPDLSG